MKHGKKLRHPNIYYNHETDTFSVRIKFSTGKVVSKFTDLPTLSAAIEWRDSTKAEHYLESLKPKVHSSTVVELVTYARAKKHNENNWRNVRLYLERILKHFGPDQELEALRPSVIESFATKLRSQNLSDDTIRKHLAELRWMMNKAIKDGTCTRPFVMPDLDPCSVRTLHINISQFRKVVAFMPTYQCPIMRMALVTMQRRRDVLRMKWSQYDGKHLHYRPSKAWKRYKEGVTVKFPPGLKNDLESIERVNEYMFLNPVTREPYENITKSINTACKRAGVPRFTFHHIKHLGITVALRLKKDIDLVARMSATSRILIEERNGHVLDHGNDLAKEMDHTVYALEAIG